MPSCFQMGIFAAAAGDMGTPTQTLPLGDAALNEVDMIGVFSYANCDPAAISLLLLQLASWMVWRRHWSPTERSELKEKRRSDSPQMKQEMGKLKPEWLWRCLLFRDLHSWREICSYISQLNKRSHTGCWHHFARAGSNLLRPI